jgi:hypothetical protein
LGSEGVAALRNGHANRDGDVCAPTQTVMGRDGKYTVTVTVMHNGDGDGDGDV